jgi:DNA-binding response OmpR family regulator
MLDSTSLIVTRDRPLVKQLREQLRGQRVAGSQMIVSDNVEEACSLLLTVRVRLAVVHLQLGHLGIEEIDTILWIASTLPWRVPLLVVTEEYLVEQAATLFRMGVSDYVSRKDHFDQLGALLASYLPHAAPAGLGTERAIVADRSAEVAASGRPSAAIPART